MRKKVKKLYLYYGVWIGTFQVTTSGYHHIKISIIHHYKLRPNTTGQNTVQIGFEMIDGIL